MAKYIQTPAYPDRMPIDISFVFEDEKPAGKHGFLQAKGDNFFFEDGTKATFWGVNFNGAACFPEHDYAEKVARRVAQSGCNIVRFHQLDAEWHTPNIFQFTRGRRMTTTRKLDAESMDRLDYLIYCLKKEGIYVYLDMLTYRKFKEADGVQFAELLFDNDAPYSFFDPVMKELQKEYMLQMWTHFNPYTGLAYKDEPAIVMSEITNENDPFIAGVQAKAGVPYYENMMRESFRDWLKKNKVDYDWENGDIWIKTSPVIDWKVDVLVAFFDEMYAYMRSIGVKIPITGSNRLRNSMPTAVSEKKMDFTDGHHYYYDWRWGEVDKYCAHEQINGHERVVGNLGVRRLNNRPYFVSEWDMPWPNAFRAEGPIFYAMISCLQNWSGMAIHTYAYGSHLENMKVLGKEASSATLNGVPYREGIFSVWNDPAKFGLFYHSALMVRRGDVSPCKKKIGLTIPTLDKVINTAYDTGTEVHRLVTIVDEKDKEDCDEIRSMKDSITHENPDIIASDNGECWRSLSKKIGFINTDRTKVIYGRLTSGKAANQTSNTELQMDGLQVEAKTNFGVVALSSLTDAATEKSDNLLLSTIGRAHNTGAHFDGDQMVELGTAPILSEVICGKIAVRTERKNMIVRAINAEGNVVGKIPAKYENGYLTFSVGDTLAAQYYLLQAE